MHGHAQHFDEMHKTKTHNLWTLAVDGGASKMIWAIQLSTLLNDFPKCKFQFCIRSTFGSSGRVFAFSVDAFSADSFSADAFSADVFYIVAFSYRTFLLNFDFIKFECVWQDKRSGSWNVDQVFDLFWSVRWFVIHLEKPSGLPLTMNSLWTLESEDKLFLKICSPVWDSPYEIFLLNKYRFVPPVKNSPMNLPAIKNPSLD